MPVPNSPALSSETNLGRQSSASQLFLNAYTGSGALTNNAIAYATTSLGYFVTDGLNGAIYWDLWENNVAGSGAIIIEGSNDVSGALALSLTWSAVGYYTIVANGTAQATLTRAVTASTLTQNTVTRLQVLDAYAYMRARVSSNGSSASLSARMYALGV